jgi:riboflavin kinase/FMN adenylyltransferase
VAAGRPELRVEAHLLGFAGELYGAELQVEIGPKLRAEQRFGSLEQLREQIERDVAAVRRAA